MQIMSDALRHIGELGWSAFQAINRRIPESDSPRPDWAPGPLLKSRERTHPPLGFPRRTDSLCPKCVVKTRNEIIRGERDLSVLVTGHEGEIPATLVEEDGKIFIRKTCDKHGSFEDLLSVDSEWSRVIERRYPGRDFATLGDELDPPPRDVQHPLRTGGRPHHRPHEPLQHDVQPLLHGREPGRLRARADDGRDQEDPGRLGLLQAAPPDVRAVLRGRAHALPALPRGLRLREEGRLLPGAGGHERPALRPRAGVRVPGQGGGLRHGLPPVRRGDEREQLPPPHLEPLRRQAARHREPVEGRHLHHPRDHGREHRERQGRGPAPRVRDPERGQEHGRDQLPARELHRPRRGHLRRGPPPPALHDLPPRPRVRAVLRGPDRPLPRLVPPRVGRSVRLPRRSPPRAGGAVRRAQLLVPSQLRQRGHDDGERPDEGVGAPLRVLQPRPLHGGHPRHRGHRARPRPEPHPDRPLLPPQLRPEQGARRPHLREAPEARQPPDGRRLHPRAAAAPGGVEAPLDRRDVVPGPLDLRLPPHGDVRDPLRHPGGRDLLLRVQHRCGVAADRREHAHGRHHQGLVRDRRAATRSTPEIARCRCPSP